MKPTADSPVSSQTSENSREEVLITGSQPIVGERRIGLTTMSSPATLGTAPNTESVAETGQEAASQAEQLEGQTTSDIGEKTRECPSALP